MPAAAIYSHGGSLIMDRPAAAGWQQSKQPTDIAAFTPAKAHMQSSIEPSQNGSSSTSSRQSAADRVQDELAQLKRQLLQAEVRLAKGRAAVSGAEVDVKVLNSRLRALTK
jgi:hypothetical protein